MSDRFKDAMDMPATSENTMVSARAGKGGGSTSGVPQPGGPALPAVDPACCVGDLPEAGLRHVRMRARTIQGQAPRRRVAQHFLQADDRSGGKEVQGAQRRGKHEAVAAGRVHEHLVDEDCEHASPCKPGSARPNSGSSAHQQPRPATHR